MRSVRYSTVRTKVLNRRLKTASVALELQIGYRMIQADGPEMATAWRPYVLSWCRGTCSRRFRSDERRYLWMRSWTQ